MFFKNTNKNKNHECFSCPSGQSNTKEKFSLKLALVKRRLLDEIYNIIDFVHGLIWG